MRITQHETEELRRMIQGENLDIRTVTLGLNLRSCVDEDISVMAKKIYDRMTSAAENLVPTASQVEKSMGFQS